MSPRDQLVEGVRRLLEQQYLESVGDQAKYNNAGLSETEKREILKAFLQKRTAGSKTGQWAKVLEDIL
jgi:hypothetical protein